jgi:hypothetical protein
VKRTSSEWRLGGGAQSDLGQVAGFVRARSRQWQVHVPALEMVPCGKVAKPAVFIKVGSLEYKAWTTTVEPRTWEWRWHATDEGNAYVALRLSIYFENTTGEPIGLGGAGTITVTTDDALRTFGHRLVCSTFFDPVDRAHRKAIDAWATAPGQSVIFFVEENLEWMNYLTIDLTVAERAVAVSALADAEQELRRLPNVAKGGFPDAATHLRKKLPPVTWWQ